ncbi:MAG: hypothetical protein AAF969_11585 [Bacteroidota bacterium]
MSTQNGQNRCPHCKAVLTPLSPAQTQLLDFINPLDAPDLVHSLKHIHNIALYHSEGPLDDPEKVALYWMKGLWERIAEIENG